MNRLTDRRLAAAKDILDKYAGWLQERHCIDSMMMEKELRDVWNVGYQTLKGIMIDMLKRDEYSVLG